MIDLDEIEARADAATEGPWEAHQDRLWIGDEEFEPLSVAKFVTKPGVTEVHYVAPMVNEPEDQEFIANARTDVPALLTLVREQQAQIGRVEALAEKWRYKGEFGWGAWQEGHGPDPEGYVLDHAAAAIRAALTATEGAA